jgi:hypothetical protein
MLTAQKENDHLKIKPLPHSRATLRSFDKVVDSIAGLRERVGVFNVEQLSATEQKLQTMSLRLGELQQTLQVLSGITQRMSRLHELVQQAETASLDQNRLVTLENGIPARSLAHVESLLKFQRVIKLVKTTKAISGLLDPVDEKTQTPFPTTIAVVPEPSKEEHPFVAVLSPVEDPIVQGAGDNSIQTAPGEDLLVPDKPHDTPPPEIDFEEFEFSSEDSANLIPADQTAQVVQKNEANVAAADTTEQPQPNGAISIVDTTLNAGQTHAAVSEEADFDRRLLEDLIKNYGEFSVLPGLPAKTNEEPNRETIIPTPRPHQATKVSLSLASHRNVPAQRKDGELDRKLKKLIKDYGEYDLYSKQSPVSLKTGVAGAFLVLTLILSGFYFFSSPKSDVPTNTSAASGSQTSLDSAAKETSLREQSVTRGPNSSDSGSKATEAGTARNTANKTKK